MRPITVFLVFTLSVQAIACGGVQQYMDEVAKNANDVCRRTYSPRGELSGYELPESNAYVCTDFAEATAFKAVADKIQQGCAPNCYRDSDEAEFSSIVCRELDAASESMWRGHPYREPILFKTAGAFVGLQYRIDEYPLDLQGIIPVSRQTLLDFERESACKSYRQELAAAAKREQEVAAAHAVQVAAEEEARRKIAAAKRAQWEGERRKEILKICPKGLGGLGDLIKANPYEVKDRCYVFVGRTLQILSRNTGFYQLNRDDRVYIDFGSGVAPSSIFQGYVKGVGVFSYTTVMGAKMIVPSLVVTDLPPDDYSPDSGD